MDINNPASNTSGLSSTKSINSTSSSEALTPGTTRSSTTESQKNVLSPEKVPANVLDQEKEIAREQLKDKPANMMEKIIEGKMKAYYDQVCLVKQKYIKNDQISIEELVNQRAKQNGKTLKVSNFIRWNVGQ